MAGIHIITDQRPGEPDIFTPIKHEPLRLKVCGKLFIECPAPEGGWNHESLQEAANQLCGGFDEASISDAYLGKTWVGSSEV
ncbi:hypothetical protein [Marinobacterium lutimaris]|uniref:Uncharacterized protein n=1 Tax=Marinobacterium lutimaris TaxID=568106 RepID=A0A1H6DXJ9_9GAMM|nr:hypothetical protein [Marinobacterium lutimaris]SEG89456.1 hypothetical protein SAMN05444390_11222 [Marinobacterium lutimaris]